MSRKTFRCILVALLVISGAFAAWSWLRPYEWSADPQARGRIVGCLIEQDHSNFWLNLQIKLPSDAQHDLERPVRLVLADGTQLEPADTTLEGDEQKPIRRIWLRFWLDNQHLEGPITLQINGGELQVRSGSGVPALGSDGNRYFVTHHW